MGTAPKALIVDLNNYARYPTMAIGYLVAALRQHSFAVDVLSPMAHGAPPFQREEPETLSIHLQRRIYFSTHPIMVRLHEFLRRLVAKREGIPHKATIASINNYLTESPVNVILLSAYLNHRASVEYIARQAQNFGIPVILGGPAFNQPKVAEDWIRIPGVSAIYGGEADLTVAKVLNDVLLDNPLKDTPGVFLRSGGLNQPAPPLTELHRLPTPDYTDFPWQNYPHPIIPVMTGRGCSWGICTFCSDVTSANGRTFRSRSTQAVMEELKTLSERHGSKDFIFLDLKLNSNLEMWNTLIDHFQEWIPGGRWIATVHVDGNGDNGLTPERLRAAKKAGLTRLSFGLETGSQRLNKLMAKGTSMERTDAFVTHASEAGISLRTSMMLGYPGETSDDIQQSIDFLKAHHDHLDRIRMSRFKAIPGTGFAQLYDEKPARFPGLEDLKWNLRFNRASYHYRPAGDKQYRLNKRRLLSLVYDINRKPFHDEIKAFDGLM